MRKLLSLTLGASLLFSMSTFTLAAADKDEDKKDESSEVEESSSVSLPEEAEEATKKVLLEVGKPKFANPNPAPVIDNDDSDSDSEDGPGNSENAPGQDKSEDSDSDKDKDKDKSDEDDSDSLESLTPAGITREIETREEATQKLENVSDQCQESVATGSQSLGCGTKNYIVRYAVGSDMEVETKGLGSRLNKNFNGVLPAVSASLSGTELAEIATYSTVIGIEEDQVISISESQSSATWSLDRLDQQSLPLSGTFDYSLDGSGVWAYVVDTGVWSTHKDFEGRVSKGYSVINDGKGTLDCNGHGTHVAGSIAGATYGVAKAAQVVPVRVLDCAGSGTLSGVIAGLSWIANNHDSTIPAVVNLSLGGGASPSLDAAVQALINQGITVVVAAGNSSSDACQASPARVAGAITVAASGSSDGFASFSNFGACVDIIAPGVGVKSTWKDSDTAVTTISGTSMATPHVAGLVAQYLQQNFTTPEEVSDTVIASSIREVIKNVPVGTPNLLANLVTSADELIDPTAPGESDLIQAPKTRPVAPGKAKVKVIGNTAIVDWDLPASSAATLTNQHVKLYAFGELLTVFDVSSSTNEMIIQGLEYGLGYAVTLIAENALGESQESVQSNIFRPRPLEKPTDGAFKQWTKQLEDNLVKIYVKYPQLGEKIQLMVQQANGEYKEVAWKRITDADLNENGEYITLTNSVYFIRTVNLLPGKNRIKVLVDGKQVGTTRTYVVK